MPEPRSPRGRRTWIPVLIALVIGAGLAAAVQQVRIAGRDNALRTTQARIGRLDVLRDGLMHYRDYLDRQLARTTLDQIRVESALRHVAGQPIRDGLHRGSLVAVEAAAPTTKIVFERVSGRWRVLTLAPDATIRIAGHASDGSHLAALLRAAPSVEATIWVDRGEVVRVIVA